LLGALGQLGPDRLARLGALVGRDPGPLLVRRVRRLHRPLHVLAVARRDRAHHGLGRCVHHLERAAPVRLDPLAPDVEAVPDDRLRVVGGRYVCLCLYGHLALPGLVMTISPPPPRAAPPSLPPRPRWPPPCGARAP